MSHLCFWLSFFFSLASSLLLLVYNTKATPLFFYQGFTEVLHFEVSASDALVNHFVNVYLHLTQRSSTFLADSVMAVFLRRVISTSQDYTCLFHHDHTLQSISSFRWICFERDENQELFALTEVAEKALKSNKC